PAAATPLTVSNETPVSTSQITRPVAVENARRWPSCEPENTAPGITVTAWDWAALQPRVPQLHTGFGGAVFQTVLPSAIRTAVSPPAPLPVVSVMSDTAA